MDGKRVRSPNYPAISLKQAVARAVMLYRQQSRHAAPREVIAKSLGFAGISGPSSTVISSLTKYGLLERVGDESRISERAMQILHPHSEGERAQALRAAASEPQLFAELNERFPGDLPSDELLKNYLLRNNFSSVAVSGVIQSYKETLEFVTHEVAAYAPSVDSTEGEQIVMSEARVPETPARLSPAPSQLQSQTPVIAMMEDHFIVNMVVRSREKARALRRMIEMAEGMLPETPNEDTIARSAPDVGEFL